MHATTDLVSPRKSVEGAAVIAGAQIRAARALLNWSGVELSERAGVSYATIQRAERSDDMPNMQSRNLVAIKRALEAAGVEFLDGHYTGTGGPGVRLGR